MKILKHLISISFLNLFIIVAVVSANPGLTPPLALPANPKPVIKLAPSLLPKPLASVPVASPPSPVNQCIIVIDGVKYDVTQFRFQHSGGNIFSCGTDMSQIFWSRHNQAILQQMQRFRI